VEPQYLEVAVVEQADLQEQELRAKQEELEEQFEFGMRTVVVVERQALSVVELVEMVLPETLLPAERVAEAVEPTRLRVQVEQAVPVEPQVEAEVVVGLQ
jgi:hypothetical protein